MLQLSAHWTETVIPVRGDIYRFSEINKNLIQIPTICIPQPTPCTLIAQVTQVMVIRWNGKNTLKNVAILDEQTIILQSAPSLQLDGEPDDLALRTVRKGVEILQGATVSFKLSSASNFTSTMLLLQFDSLCLSTHNLSLPSKGIWTATDANASGYPTALTCLRL